MALVKLEPGIRIKLMNKVAVLFKSLGGKVGNLEKDKNIVIKPSDKGGNVVVLDHKDCLHMRLRLLGDTSCYEVLTKDPTADYKDVLIEILGEAKRENLINAEEFDFLLPKFPRIATLYSLPKIRKGMHPLKGTYSVEGPKSHTKSRYLSRQDPLSICHIFTIIRKGHDGSFEETRWSLSRP